MYNCKYVHDRTNDIIFNLCQYYMNYVVIMEYKCTGRLCRVYEEDAIKLASSGKGYNGEGVDSIEMIGEPNITVEENE